MIDLYETAFKNIEVKMGQLTQAVRSRNNAVLEGEKGSSSKGKE